MLGAIMGMIPSLIGAKGDKKAKKAEQQQQQQQGPGGDDGKVMLAKADLDALIQKAAASQTSAVPGQNRLTA